MSRMVSFTSPRVAEVVDERAAPLAADEVRISTLYSGISAGTELTAYRGTQPLHHEEVGRRSSPVRRRRHELRVPGQRLGLRRGRRGRRGRRRRRRRAVGDVVWGTWGHRTETVQNGERAAKRSARPGADPRIGIFSHIGAIALNVVLDADIHVGETVAVFGLGVPGSARRAARAAQRRARDRRRRRRVPPRSRPPSSAPTSCSTRPRARSPSASVS